MIKILAALGGKLNVFERGAVFVTAYLAADERPVNPPENAFVNGRAVSFVQSQIRKITTGPLSFTVCLPAVML